MSEKLTLATELRALRAKKTTFTAFYRATRQEWQRMALALHRNWRLPPTVTVDDVEQELLLGAWLAVRKFLPSKGMTLVGYVVWCSHSRATKWVHKQRGAEQHRRKGTSQFAICVSATARDPEAAARLLESRADGAPSAEDALDYAHFLRAVPELSPTAAGREALRYFLDAHGNVDVAAREWHANREHRELFSLGRSPKGKARQIIRDEVRGVRRALLSNEDGGAE
jgi:sigma-70-like protein